MKQRPFIVNLGLPRTGQLSFLHALRYLGFNCLHLWKKGIADPDLLLGIENNELKTRGIFSAYAVLGEAPFYAMRDTFEKHYPESLLIYTTRDREEWIQTMIKFPLIGQHFFKDLYDLPGPPHRAHHYEALGAAYDKHHETVCAGLTEINIDKMPDQQIWEIVIRALPNARRYLRKINKVPWPRPDVF